MVISTNSAPHKSEFENLLSQMMHNLQSLAADNRSQLHRCSSIDIERITRDILVDCAKDTPFDNTIELVSGQNFPDITAYNYYGIEVKTTKTNHWKSVGSSVAEGTRVDGIERIFMLFGKLCDPVEFACKPYEDCLSGVVVTHSPRYSIDMCLNRGETFFDKINIPYDELRNQDNPLKTVIDYYRAQLKPGETTWWAGTGESKNSKVIVRLWSSVSEREKCEIKQKAMCLFPEIFSNSNAKFNNMNLWLASVEGVVVPNVRDLFTAGGRDMVHYNNIDYSVPRIIFNLCNNIDGIIHTLLSIPTDELREYWGKDIEKDILCDWVMLLADYAKSKSTFPITEFIISHINTKI